MKAKYESNECPFWDENFASKVELLNHINFDMDRNVKCHKCYKYFDIYGLGSCNENGGYTEQKKTLVCNTCDVIWISIPDLRKHIRKDHGEERSKEVRGPAIFPC